MKNVGNPSFDNFDETKESPKFRHFDGTCNGLYLVAGVYNPIRSLDSALRRDEGLSRVQPIYKTINFSDRKNSLIRHSSIGIRHSDRV
jgi:hypothetical protein